MYLRNNTRIILNTTPLSILPLLFSRNPIINVQGQLSLFGEPHKGINCCWSVTIDVKIDNTFIIFYHCHFGRDFHDCHFISYISHTFINIHKYSYFLLPRICSASTPVLLCVAARSLSAAAAREPRPPPFRGHGAPRPLGAWGRMPIRFQPQPKKTNDNRGDSSRTNKKKKIQKG